jgi:hypothetical protein
LGSERGPAADDRGTRAWRIEGYRGSLFLARKDLDDLLCFDLTFPWNSSCGRGFSPSVPGPGRLVFSLPTAGSTRLLNNEPLDEAVELRRWNASSAPDLHRS